VSVDAAAADAWSTFTVGEADKLALHEAALKVRKVFAGLMPGQCALMSALYSLALEKLGSQRGYIVAGSLYIGDNASSAKTRAPRVVREPRRTLRSEGVTSVPGLRATRARRRPFLET
jgi:hypothetical protein